MVDASIKHISLTVNAIKTIAKSLTKEKLQLVFYQACGEFDHTVVRELLLCGGDPFWQHPDGFSCITNAALSSIDARYKLRVLQSERVSIPYDFILVNQFLCY